MGFFLVYRAKEMRDGAIIQEVIVSSMRMRSTLTQRTAKDFEKRVAELMTDKELSYAALVRLEKEVADLKRDKENSDVAAKKFEKEVAKLKRRESLAKKLAIDKFKSS